MSLWSPSCVFIALIKSVFLLVFLMAVLSGCVRTDPPRPGPLRADECSVPSRCQIARRRQEVCGFEHNS